jgi:hypothetical protein
MVKCLHVHSISFIGLLDLGNVVEPEIKLVDCLAVLRSQNFDLVEPECHVSHSRHEIRVHLQLTYAINIHLTQGYL